MNTKEILEAVKAVREKGPKRKFKQTFDLAIRLKGVDLKKQDQKIDFYLTLPHTIGKKMKVCALVDKLSGKAKEAFDTVVIKDDFAKYKDKKKCKKLVNGHDFFVAQADLMGVVAGSFGKVLGPRGKMPNPKAGCVVPQSIPDLKPLNVKLQKTVKVATRNETSIKVPIGNEGMKDEDLVDNIDAVYSNLLPKLAQGDQNIKTISLKLTMGPFYKFGEGFKVEEKKVVKKEIKK